MNPCILLFGMPRSGTTWIGKLFDSHPDTLYRHEPDSVRMLGLPLFPEKRNASQYRQELERFVNSLPLIRHPKVVGKQPLFPKSYQSVTALLAYRASVAITKAAGSLRRNFPCLYRPSAAGCKQVHLVWKSIESSGRLGVCIEALPNARAIHLMRHPCGYVASVLRGQAAKRFGGPESAADDPWLLKLLLATPTGKARGFSLDDIERLTREERLAWCWVLSQEKILIDVEGCERVLTVRYEDVCSDPLGMTRQMFEFAGLDWQLQTETFVGASTHATNTDYYSVFKDSQASAEGWRSELTPEAIERILRILRTSTLQRFYNDDVRVPTAVAESAP